MALIGMLTVYVSDGGDGGGDGGGDDGVAVRRWLWPAQLNYREPGE